MAQEIPIWEVDRCLRTLCGCGAANEEELNFLMENYPRNTYDSRVCMGLIVDNVFCLVKERKLHRWDFDPGDSAHQDLTRRTSAILQRLPSQWSREARCQVLYDIVGRYRGRCKEIVKQFVDSFAQAQTQEEIKELTRLAMEMGIFIDSTNGPLSHCHSWLHSKRAFQAFIEAGDRIHHFANSSRISRGS